MKFFCPVCKEYYDATQRFCPKDGIRLLPGIAASESKTQNIFTKALARRESDVRKEPETQKEPTIQKEPKVQKEPESQREIQREFDDQKKTEPQTSQKEAATLEKATQEQAEKIEVWNPALIDEDEDSILEIDFEPLTSKKSQPARLVNPMTIPSGTVEPGDRTTKPLGREAFSPEKPRLLIGKTLKGRYQITNFLKQNPKNFVYLADDLITKPPRKLLVYIFVQDDFTDKVLAEERVSLSHTKHPNIAATIDSGSLPEGNLFIVAEKPQGESLEERINRKGHIEASQVAKIVRQIADALNEAHRNRILHRNLTPRNVFLVLNEKGVEQVKVAEFAVAEGSDPLYLSPEQLEGKAATSASDIFSLGVIAYQLLTKRLPFEGESRKQILALQRQGLKLKPSQLRLDVSPSVDAILEKALAYEPSQRFLLARDFGDEFYEALSKATEEELEKPISKPSVKLVSAEPLPSVPPISSAKPFPPVSPVSSAKPTSAEKSVSIKAEVKPIEPEQLQKKSLSKILFALALIVIIAILGLLLTQRFLMNKESTTKELASSPPQESSEEKTQSNQTRPQNTLYFRNLPEKLKGDLANNYRDFSFFYPVGWKIYPNERLFVDVAKKSKDDLPIEQFLVIFYPSKASLEADLAKLQRLVKESNQKFTEQLPNYRFLSEEETEFAGQKAYEMKFEAFDARRSLKIFGRRVFLPASEGSNVGLVITMIATSLSPEIKSAEDVGRKGEMKTIVETFKVRN